MFDDLAEPARQVVALAQGEARSLKHNYLGTEHLLLGLLAKEEDPAARVLRKMGIDRERARASVTEIIGVGPPPIPDADALETIGIDLEEVRRRAEATFGPGALERTRAARIADQGIRSRKRRRPWSRRPRCTPIMSGPMCFTPRAKKVLWLSQREAKSLGHPHTEPGHILLGLIREGEGLAAQVLSGLGVDLGRARALVIEALGG